MEKFITFNNIGELLKSVTRIPETSDVYQEAQDVMKQEVTAYNIERLKELVEVEKTSRN